MERLTIQRRGRGGQEAQNKLPLLLTVCSKVPEMAEPTQEPPKAWVMRVPAFHSPPALHLCLCERDFKQYPIGMLQAAL